MRKMKQKYIDLIQTFAPTIAGALGGPLAGMATKVLSETLLGKKDGTIKEIGAYLKVATPEQLAEIKKAEVRMAELGVDREVVAASDRANARLMAMTSKSLTTTILSYVIILGGFGICIAVLFVDLPLKDKVLAGTILGYILNEMKQVSTFHFGTTLGSSRKNDTIASMIKK